MSFERSHHLPLFPVCVASGSLQVFKSRWQGLLPGRVFEPSALAVHSSSPSATEAARTNYRDVFETPAFWCVVVASVLLFPLSLNETYLLSPNYEPRWPKPSVCFSPNRNVIFPHTALQLHRDKRVYSCRNMHPKVHTSFKRASRASVCRLFEPPAHCFFVSHAVVKQLFWFRDSFSLL